MPATTTDTLASIAVSTLRGVGPKTLERLERIGVTNVQDLLFHLPIRYEDRTRIIPIGSLRIHQHALFEGEVRASGIGGGRRRDQASARESYPKSRKAGSRSGHDDGRNG